MYTTADIAEYVNTRWQHDRFDFTVFASNSFTTVIELAYTEPWLGPTHDDVNHAKSVYEIWYDHAADEFQLLVPPVTCPNQQTPEPDAFSIDRNGAIRHDDLADVHDELYVGVVHDTPLLTWLADFIERHRFQRYSDVLPGVGPVNCQRLYDEYHTLRSLHEAPFDELDDKMRTSAAEQFPPLDSSTYEQSCSLS